MELSVIHYSVSESREAKRITKLLRDWREGDSVALDNLMPLIEEELKQIARQHLQHERANHTLQTTALINEVFLRIVDQREVIWQNRSHFFAIASKLMRRVLIDYARTKGRIKRGGGAEQLSLSHASLIYAEESEMLYLLDSALSKLEKMDERKVRVVEMRYFAGMSIEEIASVLEVSEITVMRDWQFARSWLRKEIENSE